MRVFLRLGALLLVALVLGLTSAQAQQDYEIGDRLEAAGGEYVDGFRVATWDDLIPPDWLPQDLFAGLFDGSDWESIDDYDPRAMEIMQKIRELWDSAPVVDGLEGARMRIPGFVVPLEGDGREIHEFLLVPYFGACIHVPPPPANQLIHVVPDQPIAASLNMQPVWVSGVMHIERMDSEMGVAGYQMQGVSVVEYLER